MHINLESDYAVRIVHTLACYNTRMDGQAIAEATGVSLRFTLKIMRKLVAAGIAKSFKGAQGGYILALPPSEISLRQVIEAVEGPYRFSRCVESEYDCNCDSDKSCPFLQVFTDITEMVIQKMDETTFDQFL